MQWIFHYQLFLFDFDGLLVDTERLHHRAYIKMCAQRGFDLSWNFQRYSQAAHYQATDLRDQIYAELPELQKQESHWQVLYEEKKHHFLNLIEEETINLMPGVVNLLTALQEANINRCVVTHSAFSLINRIRKQHPILDTIPHWITRENYSHPKPHPECYQTAINQFAQPQDRIIGFEDSPRGLHALLQTPATPVLICSPTLTYLQPLLKEQPTIHYYPSFLAIQRN